MTKQSRSRGALRLMDYHKIVDSFATNTRCRIAGSGSRPQ